MINLENVGGNKHIVILEELDFIKTPPAGCAYSIDCVLVPESKKENFMKSEVWLIIAPCLINYKSVKFYENYRNALKILSEF